MKKHIAFSVMALAMLAARLSAAASLVLTAPNGGETLTLGQTAQITWSASGVSQNLKLQLINNSGGVVGVIARNIASSPNAFSWTVGQLYDITAPAGNYKVRVRTIDGAYQDASDAVFAIAAGSVQPPSLKLAAPNGGESWSQGAVKTVSWTGANLSGNNRLELWKGNAKVGVIKSNLPAASGSFAWPAGHSTAGMAGEGTDYKVKVINSSGLEDAGDNFFAITKGMYQTSLNQTLGNQQPHAITKPGPSFKTVDFEVMNVERKSGGVIWAEVKNNGAGDYQGLLDFHMRFLLQPQDPAVSVPVNLPAGGRQWVDLQYALSMEEINKAEQGGDSDYFITVQVDCNNKILETEEANNLKVFYIASPCPVYIQSFSIVVSPAASSGPYPLPVRVNVFVYCLGQGELTFSISDPAGSTKHVDQFLKKGENKFDVWLTPIQATTPNKDKAQIQARIMNLNFECGIKESNVVDCSYQ